ncbi:recombinase family protein [Mycobacterium marinum]|uniref:recombinase family protein n=1 Tax=Mycobacterium marinum TaxID=1781 RepID=UPI00356A0DCC
MRAAVVDDRPGRTTRALIVIRLSRVTDATTSPERQLEACRALCLQRGYEVVGVAEDLDVSAGKTSPFDRPQLGDWLSNRPHEFDVVVFFRADRIVRRLFDLADLIRWCRDYSVTLVSATESHFDLSSEWGDIIAMLVAKVAEMELAAISERNASAARHNIRAGKYRGGVPPWGYRPDKATGEWRLVKDPEQVAVIREVVDRVLSGESLRSVAYALTERKNLTPRDTFARYQGRELGYQDKRCDGSDHVEACRCCDRYEWHSGGLKRSLTNETLLGYALYKGKIVRDDDGSPMVRADPILSREVFDRVGAELANRENRKEPTKRSIGLLLRVIYCAVCGQPAYRLKGGPGRSPRYRCASAQHASQKRGPNSHVEQSCGSKSILLDYADGAVERIVLSMLGESERLEREWDSGSDHSAELAEINDTLTDLTSLIGTDVYRAGTPQRTQLDARIAGYAARQAELSAEEVKPAGWRWKPTGEKFADWWARQDVAARNVWLRSMNVRLGFGPGELHLDLGDIFGLTQQMNARGPVADWQRILTDMRDNDIDGIEIRGDDIKIHPNTRKAHDDR